MSFVATETVRFTCCSVPPASMRRAGLDGPVTTSREMCYHVVRSFGLLYRVVREGKGFETGVSAARDALRMHRVPVPIHWRSGRPFGLVGDEGG